MNQQMTIAIINSSPDVVEMLRNVFSTAGFLVVSTYTHDIRDGKIDFEAFMRQHRPRVVVYDIAPPYERNLRLYEHVRAMPVVADCHFVLTTTNAARVTAMVRRDERVYEIVDRDEDLLNLVKAVKEATRARATR
jgi:DNA-binding NtrC family response regulator